MSKTSRILIVEDNLQDYELAQREIRKSLYASVFKRVHTHNEYIAELEAFQPDLILSDYSLPSFDGMKALELAKEHLPLTPLIIWTGSTSEEVAVACMKAGAHNYILKENRAALVPAVLHALEERQLLRERTQAQDRLTRSEVNYRALAENSLQGIAIFQKQRIVYVNPAMCTIMGYSADELLAMSEVQILELTHPDDRTIAQDRAVLRQAGESLSDIRDVRIIRRDGTIRWIQTFASSIEYDGQPAILATSIDITGRKQAEEKLHVQERRFRSLIENSLDSISLLSADGVLMWENPAVERVLGYPPDEFLSRNIFELMHPDDLGWTSGLFSEVAREPGGQRRGIFRLKHRDETWRWIEATATNMLEEPSVQAIVVNYRDITERKNAEQELRESQAQYRSLVETSHDLIWAVDADGRFTFVNTAAINIYGFKPEELIGRFYFDIMDPDHDHLTPETFRAAMSSRTGFHAQEVHVRHRDGRQIVLSANSIVLRDQDGLVIGVTGTSRDITEQKRAEEALRNERNLLRTLIDHLPDRIYAMDRQGKKTLSNTADWQASGVKNMEDVIGKTDFDLYPAELAETFWQADRDVLESGQPLINYEEPGLDPQGNRVAVLTSKIPLRDGSGNVIGLVGIGRDITERKNAEAQIRDLHSFNEKILHQSPLGILSYKLTGECIFANERAAAMLGATAEDLRAQNFHTITSWKTSGLYDLAEKAISSQTLASDDIYLTSTFGKQLWMAVRCVLFRANEEQHLLLSMSDITERKLAEEALRENERRYRTLFEEMPVAIWEEDFSAVKEQLDALKSQGITDLGAYLTAHPEQAKMCDEQTRILDVNHAAVEMYRAGTKERLIQATMQEISRGEQEHLVEDLLAVAEGRTSNSWEGADETCDGIPLEIRMNWSVVPGHEQDFSKVIVTTINITENKRVQQAEREQRALAEALRDTAQLLNSTLDYGEVLDHILSAVERVVPHNAGTIMLIEDNFARVVRSHGYDKFGIHNEILGVRLSLAETNNLRQMLETRQPVVISNTHTYPGWKRLEVTEWLRSSVGVPILIRDEVIGFIALDGETPGFFTPLHAERLKTFANQAALAIYNAQLLQQARDEIAERRRAEAELHHKNEDLRLLNAINSAVVRGQDLDSVIDLLAHELKRIFSAVGSTIYMLSPDKRYLTMQQYSFSHETEKRIERLIGFGIPKIEIPIKEGGHFYNSMLTKQSLLTADAEKIQEWIAEFTETRFLPPLARTAVRKLVPHIYKLLKIRSTIIVPLISQEEVIGFLDVSSASFLKPADLKRIETIAGQLTSLIQRQQANEKVRKSEEFLQGVQNSLSAHIAILDDHGLIVQVNEAWREFGDQNGLRTPDYCIGMNYFTVCESAAGPDATAAKEIAAAIHQVLSGATSEASIEYPCHSPAQKRWFIVHITCFDDGKQKWVILAHENVTERKLIEEELQHSENRYRTVVENQTEFIVRWKQDGTRTFVNDAYCRYYGIPVEQALDSNFMPFIHEDDRQMVEEKISRLLSGASSVETDSHRVLKPDGSVGWNEWTDQAIYDEDGQLVEFQSVGRDITEQKLAESALLQSQARYQDLFDKSPISLWEEDFSLVKQRIDELRENGVTDFRGYFDTHPEQLLELTSLVRIIDVNQSSLDLYGTPKKEDLLVNLSSLVDRDVLSHFCDELLGLLSPTRSFLWEGSGTAFNGRPLDLIVTGTIPSGYEDDWSRVIVSTLDIAERKRAEDELRASEERFRQLATNIEEVFWMTEAETGRELYASPAMEKIWGIPGEALQHQPDLFLNSVLPADRSIVLSGIEREKAGERVEMEYRIVHSDGSVHWIWDRAFPIFDENGKVKILAGISADITSRKQSELEIQRHLAELEALYENGLAIGRLLEPKEIGNQIIQTFARYLSWHHVAIRLLHPQTDNLELIAFNQPDLSDEARADVMMRFSTMVHKVGQGLSGFAMQTGKSIRTGNVHTHPQYVDTHQGILSGLYMPLRAGDRVIGCISVESDQPDAFSAQDERLLATLANQAAIAFENARLYQSMQQELVERKRAQEALWASETHYRQLADSITDILFELDQDLRYTHWNKASEMFSGIPAEDIIGKSMQEIEAIETEGFKRPEIYQSVLKERQAKVFEISTNTKRHKRDLEVSAYPSARGVSVVARDVTERKVFEALLQKRFELIEYASHHSLQQVMQKVIDEVSALTESHIGFLVLVDADEQTLSMQTWSTETIKHFHDTPAEKLHYPLNRAGVWAEAVRQRHSLIHNDYEVLPHKNGLPEGHGRLVREMVIPILRNEKIVAVIGVGNKEHEYTEQDIAVAERFADYAWDITERRRIESELAEERNQLARRVEERTADLSRANANLARALRVKDEFLANMSHELRTPLNAILGLSESLSEQVAGPLNEKQSKYLSTINESGHHLLSLINDILDLAKIEAGQITLDINKVDINSVCQASLRMVKQLAQKKNQDVSFEINPHLGLMWADERRLKQMIVNLLSNAVKFTPESGKLGLEVSGDEEANTVSITVWDEGIGISENDIQRLFRPFVQLDAGLAREATGTGLGLALVAQMAQLHGGSVIVDSRPGKGSSFTIRLPWQPAMAGETLARLKATGKFRAIRPGEVRPTILLIEDTQEVVMMLVDYLEMAGFNMVTAQDGIDGLTQAKIARPDLILMDIQMPRMDGFETTQKLRSDPDFKEIPIIALTALAMPNDRQRCLDAGMNDYLSKPVNLKALSKTIKAFLLESEGNPL